MTTTKAVSARRWHRASAATALAGLMALTAGVATAQNLVVNGDFTQFTTPTTNNPDTGLPYTSFNTKDKDSTATTSGHLLGWTQSNAPTSSAYRDGNVGTLLTGNDNDTFYRTNGASGNSFCCGLAWSKATVQRAYDINHAYPDPATVNNTWDGWGPNGANFWTTLSNYYSGALSQSIILQKDQQYTLSFAWAVGQAVSGIEHGWGGWNVSLGNQPVQVLKSAEVGVAQFSGWSTYTYTFTANSTGPATLMFSPIGAAPQLDMLSGISVTAVPEPTTMLMFGLGLAGLMVVRRRTR